MPLITDTIMCFICPDLISPSIVIATWACGLLECALIATLTSIKWLKVLVLMTF